MHIIFLIVREILLRLSLRRIGYIIETGKKSDRYDKKWKMQSISGPNSNREFDTIYVILPWELRVIRAIAW